MKLGDLFVWKSICKGWEVVNIGSRWKVGYGERIRNWEDKWFPLPLSFRNFSPRPPDCNLIQVSDLFDPNNKCWKSNVVTDLFSDLEASLIISLPISQRLPEDRVIWHFDKKGLFSIKSAYHVALNMIMARSHHASPSGESQTSVLWMRI